MIVTKDKKDLLVAIDELKRSEKNYSHTYYGKPT